MMQPLSKQMALRIGLAARELPDIDNRSLLNILENAIGLPPTVNALNGLTVKKLKTAADGVLNDCPQEALKKALAYLKDENADNQQLPDIEAYQEGDMPDSIRVACASNRETLLDGHFGSCRRFLIYQVSAQESRLIAIRATDDEADSDDKNAYRAELIADCQIVFVASIGGPATAKVVKVGVHPIKKPQPEAASKTIAELQQAIANSPPPWLAKIMGQSPEQRVRFTREEEL